ncbi:flavodoxin [Anaerotignum sp.]
MKNAVIYWSGTGNTAAMAKAIAAAMGEDTEIFSVDKFTGSVADYDKIAFGCSAMGDEVLEEAEFEPFFASIEGSLKGKKVALFGSYGWGDGQWMRDWADRTAKAGANLYDEGLIVNGFPEGDAKVQCTAYGEGFAAY